MERKKDHITFTSTHTIPHSLYRFHRGNDERPFLSDTDLVCKGGYIPVHSVVLMAGSPVLKQHIIDQSRAQRDHMVVHLLDYHISDMTHVVTCFYTGVCTFPRNRANTIFEIFEQLGVGPSGMSFATATPEDMKKRSHVRRYLDCDDDDEDDMMIEDGEVIPLGDLPLTALPSNVAQVTDEKQPTPKPVELAISSPDVTTSNPIPEDPVPAPASTPDPAPALNSDVVTYENETRSRNKKKRRKVVLLPKPQPPELKSRGAKVLRDGTSGIKNSDSKSQADDSDNDSDRKEHQNAVRKTSKKSPEMIDNKNNDDRSDKMDESSSDDEKETPPKKGKATTKRRASASLRSSSKRKKKSDSLAASSSEKKSDEEEGSVYKASDEDDEDDDESEHSELEEELDSGSFIVEDSSEDQEFVPETKNKRSLRSKRGRSDLTRTQKKLRNLPARRSKERAPVQTRTGLRQLRNRVTKIPESKDESEEEEENEEDNESEASEPSHDKEVNKKRTPKTRSRKRKVINSDTSSETSEEPELDEASNFRRETCNDGGSNDSDDDTDDDAEGIDPAERCYLRSLVIRINKLPDEEIQKHCNRNRSQRTNDNINPVAEKIVDEGAKVISTGADTSRNKKQSHPKVSGGQSAGPKSSKNQPNSHINNATPAKETVDSQAKSVNSLLVKDSESNETESNSFSVSPQQVVEAIKACPKRTSLQATGFSEKQSHAMIKNCIKWRDTTLNCPICKQDFSNYIGASRCIRSHKKFRCWICLEICDDSTSYIDHCKSKHSNGNLKSGQTSCPICEHIVPWNSVQNHISQTHFNNIGFESASQLCSSAETQPSNVGEVANSSESDDKEIESEDENVRPLVTIKDPHLLFESDHDDDTPGPSSGSAAVSQQDRSVPKRRGRPSRSNKKDRISEDRRIAEAIGRERPKRNVRTKAAAKSNDNAHNEATAEPSNVTQVTQEAPANAIPVTQNHLIEARNTPDGIEKRRTSSTKDGMANSSQPHNSTERFVTRSSNLPANISTDRSGTNNSSLPSIAAEQSAINNASLPLVFAEPAAVLNPSVANTSTGRNAAFKGLPNLTNKLSAGFSPGIRNGSPIASPPVPISAPTNPESLSAISDPPVSVPSSGNNVRSEIHRNSPVSNKESSDVVLARNSVVSSNPTTTTPPVPAATVNPEGIASAIVNLLRSNNQSKNTPSPQTHNSVNNSAVVSSSVVAPPSRVPHTLSSQGNVSVGNHDSPGVDGALPIAGRVLTRLISNPPSAASTPVGSLLLSSRNAVGMQQVPYSYQHQPVVSQQPPAVSPYTAMQPPAVIERRIAQASYQPSSNSDIGPAGPVAAASASVSMMLSSRDLSSAASTETNSSKFCGTTTIGGVPFKIFSRSGTAEPHPHAIVTVSEDRSYPQRCNIRTPQNATRPNQSYPNIPNVSHQMIVATQNFQNALQVQDSHDINRNSNGNSHTDHRFQQALAVESASNTIRCDRCDEQFRCQDSFEHHLCLGPED